MPTLTIHRPISAGRTPFCKSQCYLMNRKGFPKSTPNAFIEKTLKKLFRTRKIIPRIHGNDKPHSKLPVRSFGEYKTVHTRDGQRNLEKVRECETTCNSHPLFPVGKFPHIWWQPPAVKTSMAFSLKCAMERKLKAQSAHQLTKTFQQPREKLFSDGIIPQNVTSAMGKGVPAAPIPPK